MRHRAIVVGDSLVDFCGGLDAWPQEDLPIPRRQVLEQLRPLLALPVELVLATHGGPADRAALERAFSSRRIVRAMLGRSFALTPAEVADLLAQADDATRDDWLSEFEEGESPYVDFDKAWDALHRCLGDGELVIPGAGTPLAHAVFGSVPLMEHEETETFAGLSAGR